MTCRESLRNFERGDDEPQASSIDSEEFGNWCRVLHKDGLHACVVSTYVLFPQV